MQQFRFEKGERRRRETPTLYGGSYTDKENPSSCHDALDRGPSLPPFVRSDTTGSHSEDETHFDVPKDLIFESSKSLPECETVVLKKRANDRGVSVLSRGERKKESGIRTSVERKNT